MKKGFALLTLIALLFTGSFSAYAQNSEAVIKYLSEQSNDDETTEAITADEETADEETAEEITATEEATATKKPAKQKEEEASFQQIIKEKFMEGGPAFMGDCTSLFNFRIGSCNREELFT